MSLRRAGVVNGDCAFGGLPRYLPFRLEGGLVVLAQQLFSFLGSQTGTHTVAPFSCENFSAHTIFHSFVCACSTLLCVIVTSRSGVACRVDRWSSAAVARVWASAAKMTRQSRLQQLFVVIRENGVDKYQCKCCGESFSKSNAYRHCRADSPKHCPYLFAHDSEEGLHVMEWVPQVWCYHSYALS